MTLIACGLLCAVTIIIIIILSVIIASITTPPRAGEQLLVARVAIVELILSLVSAIIYKR